MLIGVTGPNAAGKGEVTGYLAQQGFRVLSLSDILRETLRREGVSETRERMIEVGARLREEHGPGVLAIQTLEKLGPDHDYAIDSIRHPGEVETLAGGTRRFVLVWVDADPRVRFERLRARGRSGDPTRFEVFQELESRELASPDSAGQQLLAVKALAHHVVHNDGSVAALQGQVAAWLAGLS